MSDGKPSRSKSRDRLLDQRGLLVLFAGAAAAGVYIEATRDRSEDTTGPPASAARATAGATPGKLAWHWPNKRQVETARAKLKDLVKPGATDAKSPWALAHGLIAYGKDLVANDGRSAVEVIVSFAEPQVANGRTVYRFPAELDGAPVEPHRDLLVKAMVEAGVDLDVGHRASDGKSVTLRELVEASATRATVPTDDRSWHHVAWTLTALSRLDARGSREHADLLAELRTASLERLEADHAPVLESLETDADRAFEPGTPMRRAKEGKSHVYGHSCGGLHFARAVIESFDAGAPGAIRERIEHQVDALLIRHEAERNLYAKMLRDAPAQGLVIRVQQLKFFGHLLETLNGARARATGDRGKRLDAAARRAAGDVVATFAELDRGGVYHRLATLRTERPQTALDLIGDGCHAIAGLQGTDDLFAE